MAESDSTDILMKFVLDGVAIEGESSSAVSGSGSFWSSFLSSPAGSLMKGFYPGSMFEIDSFTFNVGVDGDSDADRKAKQMNPAQWGGAMMHASQFGGNNPQGSQPGRGQVGMGGMSGLMALFGAQSKPSSLGGFKAWRSGLSHKKYPVNVQPITISRPIDTASTTLLDHCIKCTSFDSASLVKRKAAGGNVGGEAFLRIDFKGVLITDVSWSNDDRVKETLKFISRAITVKYKPQLEDGTMGAVVHGFWSMLPWEHEEPSA